MTNITSHDELEKAFRESEGRFRDLVEGSIEGIMIHRDFKPLFVNSTYAEIFGFDSPEEVMALDWVLELAAPHEQAKAMGYAAARLRGDDAPTDYEYKGLRKDRSTIWLDNRVRVISWQGEPAIQSTVVDITERKRAEEALQKSEEKFRNLAEGSKQGLCIHRGWTPVFTNQAFADIYGFDNPEQVIASGSIEPFYAAHEINRLLGYRAKRLKGEEAPEWYVCESRRRDGAVIWTEHNVRMIDWDGEPAVQCTVIDITERKRAEEALLQAQDELLQKERLATLGELTGTVSHELRNPLGTIRNSLMVVGAKTRDLGLGIEGEFDRAMRSISRCNGIIEELFEYATSRPVTLQDTSLDAWLTEVLDDLAVPEGITVRQALAADDMSVPMDRERMRRVIINLYDNACQAMTEEEDKERTLTIGTEAIGNEVKILVTDTGTGMSKDTVAQIFEPLFSTKIFGVGLGLPIVKRIIEQHDGKLEVTSEEGRGTRLVLRLPARRPEGEVS